MKKINIIVTFIICLLLDTLSYSQVSFLGNAYPGGTKYLGWDNSASVSLDIINNSVSPTMPIDFYINTTKFLQVLTSGDLNVFQPANGYMINNSYVLRHNNIPSSIYVGVGAGNANATYSNTFLGDSCGIKSGNTTVLGLHGSCNTFTGHLAGANNDIGHENCFYGDSAGFRNDTGYHNVFIGASAGLSNIYGISNTFIGFEAGYGDTSGQFNTVTGRGAWKFGKGSDNSIYGKDAADGILGSGNCYYGAHAGDDADTASYNSVFGDVAGEYCKGTLNCFFGVASAPNLLRGDSNTFVGAKTQFNSVSSLRNSGGFGFGVSANSNNKIIIGNNRDSVGIGLSDDVTYLGPRNKLEINADPNNMTYTGTNGSGIQFRQLKSSSTPYWANYIPPSGKVLTVDDTGNVKLTDGASIGYGLCNNPYVLTGDIGMTLNDNRIYYDGNGFTGAPYDINNSIGLGFSCNTTLPGKLSVDQSFSGGDVYQPTIAGYFNNGDYTTSASTAFAKRGIAAICDGVTPIADETHGMSNIAGDFDVSNCDEFNIAVRGRTNKLSPSSTGMFSYGGWFEANLSPSDNIGVNASTDARGSSANYGIYAYSPASVCTTGSCVSAAAYFNGDVYCTTSNYWGSDIRLKDNIQPLVNGLSVINALNPKTFTYRINQFPNITLPHGNQDGLIAQDVQALLPNLVSSFKIPSHVDSLGNLDTTGTSSPFLAVNYIGIIPYLIDAVKEENHSNDSLKSLIDTLKMNDSLMSNRLDQLEQLINNCCSSSGNPSGRVRNPIDIDLSNDNSVILNPASPDPFSEQTKIMYFIPSTVTDAKIIFFDNLGHVLQTVIINERGNGQINVYAENLSSGIYSYSLIADGKVIDTKKMVCSK